MLIDAPSRWSTHRSCFEDGNQSAALVHDTLRRRLSSCGAMAGDASIAEEFASAYDEAAASSRSARSATWSTPSRRAAGSPRPPWPTTAKPRTARSSPAAPSSRARPAWPATSPSSPARSPPPWAATSPDCPRLGVVDPRPGRGLRLPGRRRGPAARGRPGVARRVPRRLLTSPAVLHDCCPAASRGSRSPEVPIAVEVTERVAPPPTADRSPDQCAVLARACHQYADHVEEQRAADPRPRPRPAPRRGDHPGHRDRARRGHRRHPPAAPAAALNAAKIAAAAPRLLRIITTLRSLAATRAAPVRIAASALRDVRLELVVFQRAPHHGRLGVRRRAAGACGPSVAHVVQHSRLFTPQELRGLSSKQMDESSERLGGPPLPRPATVRAHACPMEQGPPDSGHGRLPAWESARPRDVGAL